MSRNWNEPLPLMDTVMCNRMIRKTDEYLTMVNWQNNGTANTLEDAVAIAKLGKDIGFDGTMQLRPTDRIFNNWMNWNALVTYLYNRDTQNRTLLSAFRNPIQAHTMTTQVSLFNLNKISHYPADDDRSDCSYGYILLYGVPVVSGRFV